MSTGGIFTLMTNQGPMDRLIMGFTGGREKAVDHNKEYTSADEVIDGLWIGNQASSSDIGFLKRHDIKTIINCSSHIPFIDHSKHKRVAVRISVSDPGPFKPIEHPDVARMYRSMPDAVEIIRQSLAKGGVLVHCHAGKQRSAAVIVAYLLHHHFTDGECSQEAYDRAVKYLREKRPQVFYKGWHVNFQHAIKRYMQHHIC
jgi:protein tyrosine/serine phosphatase